MGGGGGGGVGTGGGVATGGGAATGGGGSATGGGTQTGPVTGHALDFFRLEASEVSQPSTNLASAQALALQADGGFTIPDAPNGEYYVVFNGWYVVSTSRTLDLDNHNHLGPPGMLDFVGTPAVNVTATGLQPNFSDFDLIEPNELGWGDILLDNAVTGPSITSTGTYFGVGALPSGVAQNHTWVAEVVDCTLLPDGGQAVPADGGALLTFCNVYGPSVELTGFDVAADGGSSLTFNLAATPPAAAPLSGNFDTASFTAHATDVNPAASLVSVDVAIAQTPNAPGLTPGWIGYSGEMLFASLDTGPTNPSFSIPYADPFPADWARVVTYDHYFYGPTLLPGTTTGHVGGFVQEVRLLGNQPATLVSRVSPPTGLSIDGVLAGSAGTFARLTPQLTWHAPAVGTVSGYQLSIYSLTANGSQTVRNEVVFAITSGTHFQVPAGKLTSGGNYVVRLSALYMPGVQLEQLPFSNFTAVDLSGADTLSGIWHAP
jgi:hypothetical protein